MKKIVINWFLFILTFALLYCNKEQVLLVSIANINPIQAYPETEITITGNNLDQISKIKFGDNFLVEPKSKTKSSLTVEVPILVPGNINVKAITKNVESNTMSITILKTIPPSISTAKIKAFWGTLLTIRGANMKKVNNVNFGNTKVTPKETANDYLIVEVPQLNSLPILNISSK